MTVASMGALLLVGACSAPPMAPMSTMLSARLSGASEVPNVMSDATGTVDASLEPDSRVLTWRISYSGLSGPVTAAHFHGPAMAGQNAAPVVPIGGPLLSPIMGRATLTPSQAADLIAGKWYLNLHTTAHPNGEARGQVNVRP
ncbi:CHRD domain-containing protein [Ideonella sp. 3Y2]|uniref:CHRD domain-containing protein n=2 Tax=Ideonella alba TaxID=2824118 RepID=A0A940Y3K0_9BURK|nr:CHRD domain-containing protein [Ideonella alba]